MLRRTFLSAIAGAGAIASAQVPVRFRLGLDSYALRAFGWKAIELIDYAASQQLDSIQLDMENLESRDRAYLQRVRDHAAQRQIYVDAATGCVCPTSSAFHPKSKDPVEYLAESLDAAKAIGASVMRCFLGSRAERNGSLPIEAHMEAIVRVFRAARQRALDAGVKIALENHNGDLAAREVRTIIEQAGKDFVGSCLDTGNPMWLLEDPVETVEILGPYAVTSHIRDSVLYEHPRGAAFQWVALGDGTMNWPAILERLTRLCPHIPLQMEVITGRPPQVLPYLEPEFWKAFPNKPAEELARFIALTKKGHPYDGFMVVADSMQKIPPEYAAALREQQKWDFERSVIYAKERLGLGIRSRVGAATNLSR